jgi:hypothetical protein
MIEQYKRFPPGRGAVMLPLSSRSGALAALAMYSAVRPRAVLAQRVARLAVALFGARILPGRPAAWRRPIADEIWRELLRRWRDELGDFDSMAVYERQHENRPGAALLLLRKGTPTAFVKVRSTDVESLVNEARALEAVWRARPRSFSVARPLASGKQDGWYYLAMAPLPPFLHSIPSSPPLESVMNELRAALADCPRPEGTPAHWQPMHGDFTPWNLRETSSGELTLVDWEYSGWGPPGADEVLYRASSAAVAGRDPGRTDMHEAIHFWIDRMTSWPETQDRDGRLVRDVVHALRRLDGES